MKNIAAIAILATCASLVLGHSLRAQESKPTKHLLRYHHEVGHVGAFKITNDVEMRFVIDKDREMKISTVTTTYAKYEITAMTGDLAEVKLSFFRLASSMTNQSGKTISFDTLEKDFDAGIMKPMLAILNGEVSFKLSSRGTVSSIRIPPKLSPIISQAFGGDDPAQMFRQFLIELPEAAVAVGGSWQTKLKQTINRVGKLDVTADNKLSSIRQGIASIDQVTKFKLEEKQDIGEFEMKDAGGKVVIDPKLAFPAALGTTMHLKITSGGRRSVGTIHMRMTSSMVPAEVPSDKTAQPTSQPTKGSKKK